MKARMFRYPWFRRRQAYRRFWRAVFGAIVFVFTFGHSWR